MKAYISASFSHRDTLKPELAAIAEVLAAAGIIPFVFTDQYRFTAAAEREMMQQAMLEIDVADLLLAETTDKAIGVGVEAGYAKAKGKPVIYLRQSAAEHSTTVSGISDKSILYDDVHDLKSKLAAVLYELFPGRM